MYKFHSNLLLSSPVPNSQTPKDQPTQSNSVKIISKETGADTKIFVEELMPEADFQPIQEQDIKDDMEETTEVTLKLILISIKLFLC